MNNCQESCVEEHTRRFYQACYEAVVVHLYNLAHPNAARAFTERHWIVLPEFEHEEREDEFYDFRNGKDSLSPGLLEALIGRFVNN